MDRYRRRQHSRAGLRYQAILRDAEWVVLEPAAPCEGWRRAAQHRPARVMNAILYLATGDCQWRMLPKDFRRSRQFSATSTLGATAGLWQAINHPAGLAARESPDARPVPTPG
ncbi:transposase [Novosphingobium sp.]|uniref:transposase n=1 Tax=Novosphingobium sp. TaxID=1874826 RepID=UPI0025D35DD3|nr:transposase [Novosphingobium sp.]